MHPCESPFSLLLHFLSRRFDVSPPSCDAGAVDSRRIFRDYAIREINLLLWFSLFAITALLLAKLSTLFKLWSHGSRIPGLPSPSFYGHSELFSGRDSRHDLSGLRAIFLSFGGVFMVILCSSLVAIPVTISLLCSISLRMRLLVKSHKKYGSIVKLWLSPTQLLVSIKDPSLIHEMLSKAVDKLPLTGRVYRLAFGQSSFFVSSFEKVKKERESLILELNRRLLEKTSLMTDRVLDSVMERTKGIMDKGTLDCGMFSQHMAFSILGATLFGDAFFAWSKANVYEELLIRIAKDACFWASYSVPPFWKRGYWKYQHLCTRLKSLTQDIVQQCRMNYKLLCQPSGKSGIEVASDIWPEKTSSQESCGHLNLREEPCGNVMGMMFHGCLTTSALISNILARLVMHPDIQEKIYSEVVMIRKQSDKLKKQDVSEMHLLLATVYESARLLPAGPLLQRCSLRQDLELKNGMRIPAGAMLVAPIQVVQTDELNWGSDAEQFNPYRFLAKTENESELGNHLNAAGVPVDLAEGSYVLNDPHKSTAFFPFGSGLRACVGQKFAVHGIASIFASLLEHYQIKLHPESELNPEPLMVNCVLQLVPSPKIVFVRRDNH